MSSRASRFIWDFEVLADLPVLIDLSLQHELCDIDLWLLPEFFPVVSSRIAQYSAMRGPSDTDSISLKEPALEGLEDFPHCCSAVMPAVFWRCRLAPELRGRSLLPKREEHSECELCDLMLLTDGAAVLASDSVGSK